MVYNSIPGGEPFVADPAPERQVLEVVYPVVLEEVAERVVAVGAAGALVLPLVDQLVYFEGLLGVELLDAVLVRGTEVADHGGRHVHPLLVLFHLTLDVEPLAAVVAHQVAYKNILINVPRGILDWDALLSTWTNTCHSIKTVWANKLSIPSRNKPCILHVLSSI